MGVLHTNTYNTMKLQVNFLMPTNTTSNIPIIPTMKTNTLTHSLLLIAVILMVNTIHAQVLWNKTSGTNDYTNAANWDGGAVPTASQTAAFNTNGDQTVQFNASLATNPQNLTVGTTGNTLTFKSAGAAQTVVNAGANMILGSSSGANIIIQKTGAGNFIFRSAGSFQVGGTGGNNNTVTAQGTNVTVGSANSIVIVGFDNSSGNTLHIKDGATLSSGGGTIGRANGSTNNIIRLSGTNTTWNVGGTAGANNITIGVSAGNDNNILTVESGAKIASAQPLNVYRGTVHLDNGTINLTNQALTFQAAGRLRGQGTITASEVKSTAAGAIVEVGESGFGALNVTATNWNNTNIALQLGIGDMSGSPIAGVNYDWLNINGTFTYGGSLTIDLTNAILPIGTNAYALINWTNALGSTNNLSVNFINGSTPDYEFRSDGFYIVPEPAVTGLLLVAGGLVSLLGLRRRG